jgi:hypothetical protein
MLTLATGDQDGALRDALLGYVRGVEETPPTTEGADATGLGNLPAIDAARIEFGGATGTAMR